MTPPIDSSSGHNVHPPLGGSTPPTLPPPSLGVAPPNPMDPTGVWAKFLSVPGHPATPKDIQMFIQGLLKSFSLLIQQSNEAAQRASDQAKQALNGG